MTTLTLIDPRPVWAGLPAEVRDLIGHAALTYAIAYGCIVTVSGKGDRLTPQEIAMVEATAWLADMTQSILGDRLAKGAAPDLDAIGVAQCHGCGCTDAIGCATGCSWRKPNVCSCCAPRGTTASPFVAESAQ